ncbi:TetR/AcrR family transcriptional regulator [uncultured Zobellia sp.]|uniref:TetR/AcrR family transcriptional regulator n=1 Tax=uncultured Zobellia sp. TaxID=255433 RepID=UPI0025961DE2|nr:TetR/AcrR family transcriptional regulator [uncultured Zobellia sp.]
MARRKQYNEDEVIEKATALFWRNGYEATTVRMLEKEMGINQFSIYSSFGNKQGVFVESINAYRKRVRVITDKLSKSNNGKEGIKQYFYDFLEFAKEDGKNRGCLVTNTVNEINADADPVIMEQLIEFANSIKQLFVDNLLQEEGKTQEEAIRQSNYLMNTLLGLSVSSKVFDQNQINDTIEITFLNI